MLDIKVIFRDILLFLENVKQKKVNLSKVVLYIMTKNDNELDLYILFAGLNLKKKYFCFRINENDVKFVK